MDLRGVITAVGLLLISSACAVDSVCAWQHPFHERAARLSQLTLPGNYRIEWNGVFAGAREPDFRRDDCPWVNQSHKSDHWRIKASGDAAVKTLRNHVDPTLAGRRLGRAFHYLQDQTETSPRTKTRFSRVFPRLQFRGAADFVLASIEQYPGGMVSGSLSFSKYWRDRTQEYSRYYNWSQIYAAVDNLRSGFDHRMNAAMNAAPDIGQVVEVFHWYFASLVALQNQIIRLYAEDLKDTRAFLNQLDGTSPARPASTENQQGARTPAPTSSQRCRDVCVREETRYVNITDNRSGLCAGRTGKVWTGAIYVTCEKRIECVRWEKHCQ